MKNSISNISTSKAAQIVGVAFITSVIIVTLVDDFLLANFVIPGDTEVFAMDIKRNDTVFGFAVAGYFMVLVLDAIIGLGFYVVLKPANKNMAIIIAALRLVYVFTVLVGMFALVLQIIDVYGYAFLKLIGYAFFALHIFILGYTIVTSDYIPKSLGALLILASFTYITFYVNFQLPEDFETTLMFMMGIAELALSIWLLPKRNTLPENN